MTTEKEVKGTETKLNLFQKLVEVRRRVPYLKKENEGYKFAYVSSSQAVAAIREQMDKLGLLLFPHVIDTQLQTTIQDIHSNDGKPPKPRTTYFTEIKINFEWVDSETGESKIVPFYAQGLDYDGEKGIGKALTYAEKYFILKQFNIPTDKDDPDYFANKQQSSSANLIDIEQVNELADIVETIAEQRNVPGASIIQQLGFDDLAKVRIEQYTSVRAQLKAWVRQEGAAPTTVQNQTQQDTFQQGAFQEQQPQVQTQAQDAGITYADTVNLDSVTMATDNKQQPYVAINVVGTGGNQYTLVSRNPEHMSLPLNATASVRYAVQNGVNNLIELTNVKVFESTAQQGTIQQQQPTQNQEQQQGQTELSTNFVNATILQTSPVGDMNGETYVAFTAQLGNQMMNFLAKGELANKVANLAQGHQLSIAYELDGGFNVLTNIA